MDTENTLIKIFAGNLRNIFQMADICFENLMEIRLRVNNPLSIRYSNEELFISKGGKFETNYKNAYIVTMDDISKTMEYIGNYSLYAFDEEIRQGFITIYGGHRIGIAGQVIADDDKIRGIKNISFINIRVAHQIIGCADDIISYLYENGQLLDCLIISPPGLGKTTLLRDIIRQVSDGNNGSQGLKVGIVDERSEIAGCYLGIPGNDVGRRTDVMDCCPKKQGMMMLIRSMSPEVIAIDEIGGEEDICAISKVINCGCKIIATIHASSYDEADEKLKNIYKNFKLKILLERQIDNKILITVKMKDKYINKIEWYKKGGVYD